MGQYLSSTFVVIILVSDKINLLMIKQGPVRIMNLYFKFNTIYIQAEQNKCNIVWQKSY